MTSALQIWKLDVDPDDAVAPYTPYDFTSTGKPGIAKFSITRDFARRESVLTVPGMDSVLDGYGKVGGPMDRRDLTITFTIFTKGGNDAAYDLFLAQIAGGAPVRLAYTTDAGAQWFTIAYNAKVQNTNTSDNRWGAGGEVNFVVTFRIRPWWTPRYSEASERFHTGTTFAPGTTFGSAGVTVIAANPQAFNVTATGTAGVDLPTIPDTGPYFTFHGPCGGDGGFQVINYQSFERDSNGTLVNTYFVVPFKLPTASDVADLDFAAQRFSVTIAGVKSSFRPTKPVDQNLMSYQRDWFRIIPGVVNGCAVVAAGASPVTGGSVKCDFWRRRA